MIDNHQKGYAKDHIPSLRLVPKPDPLDFPWDNELGKPHGEIGGGLTSYAANNPIPEICPKCGTTKRGERHACYSPVPADFDPVTRPKHYTSHPSGVQFLDIAQHMNFCLGNVLKYIWRADLKGGTEDLKKAREYLNKEIARREAK